MHAHTHTQKHKESVSRVPLWEDTLLCERHVCLGQSRKRARVKVREWEAREMQRSDTNYYSNFCCLEICSPSLLLSGPSLCSSVFTCLTTVSSCDVFLVLFRFSNTVVPHLFSAVFSLCMFLLHFRVNYSLTSVKLKHHSFICYQSFISTHPASLFYAAHWLANILYSYFFFNSKSLCLEVFYWAWVVFNDWLPD